MRFNLDVNIKIGEDLPKHVAVITIYEPESGEKNTFTGSISSDGQMGPELTKFILREFESWISLKLDEEDDK